jgi:hypothetical protein
LTEPVPDLMHCVRDGVACGVGPVAEALADVIESAANMVLGEIIACGVKIALRERAVAIAGGKGQRQGQQAQAGQSHINDPFAAHFVHPRASFNIPVQAAGDRPVKLEVPIAWAEMPGGPPQTALCSACREFRDRAVAARDTTDMVSHEEGELLLELDRYTRGQCSKLVNHRARRRTGQWVSTSVVESTVNSLVNRRMNKRQQRRRSPVGAHDLLPVRAAVLNDTHYLAALREAEPMSSANDNFCTETTRTPCRARYCDLALST